ncbi:MAG: DEAD/DEAH box helicase [Ignavibacteria bacterium]|nr:DEAD/DEAH box helicase [Ignavibacteria bacterium]NCS81013.1 DEAD/DEAH box helicase [Ignavibacteria bacterium]OIO23792.1 MAG: RNA helicase [Ignavibacteria bacterium CG1_02_37_35]PJC57725.1 MAG: RNA helicase [Ignavibacteria bacterium CG_4_9_14_0_2_um_filter_37_13]
MTTAFNGLGLSDEMLQAIKMKGFEEPTEIQSKIIPLILQSENDLIGQAQTGTGKTAAFALPIIDKLELKASHLQVLVLVPTRELAIQVAEEFNSLRGHKNIHVTPIYGGQSYDTQLRRLKKGVDVIVGTPGRVMDLLKRKIFSLGKLSFVVLDEADEMLNMGFIEDIEEILSGANPERRTFLFSATMPERISNLAKKYMKNREIVKAKHAGQTISLTDQVYFEVRESEKLEALCRIIDTTNEFYGIVFCRTKNDVDYITSKLHDRDYDSEGLHGDISQAQREKILNKFKKKKTNVLVATDVAARGLDIDDLTHVINFALPQDPEAYLHRIGRTGRAGKEGTAITFVSPEEYRKLMFIKNITKTDIRKGRIPRVQEVINFKKEKIAIEIKNLITKGVSSNYVTLAKDLLEGNSAEEITSALIQYAFQNSLEEGSYANVQDFFESKRQPGKFESKGSGSRGRQETRGGRGREERPRDGRRRDDSRGGERRGREEGGFRSEGRERGGKGQERLFIAAGKKDGLSPKKLVDMLMQKTNIESRRIDAVQVMDSYSFFSVSPRDAEVVLEKLNSKKKGDRSVVERAKPSK